MPRPAEDRAADRQLVVDLIPKLRAARADLRTAIKALPARAQRNAGQQRDALIMRTLALLVQTVLAMLGATITADRDPTED